MINKKIVLALTFSLVGCTTSVKYNYTQQNYNSMNTSYPPIGEVTTSPLGEAMLLQGISVEQDVLVIPTELKSDRYLILLNGYYEKVGTNGDTQIFVANNSHLKTGGVLLRRNTIDSTYKIALKKNNKICAVPLFGADHCTDNTNAHISRITTNSKDSFQRTLIYSGKVGNKINISYREFYSNSARPAFNNNVEYDLSESKEIGYKGALLQIIRADNQNITYKVLKNFNNMD
ncbi:hypothetical protein [Acinetobacter ursingii]|uniref:hypothetical protein n=1 Tax=Acinetobacter ursingii TaxID=108980 RepID=UPI00124F4F7F|nr:hypothetical protein [Acinetobacter ursingii]